LAETSLDNAYRVVEFLVRNQVMSKAEKENYARNIAQELGFTRTTVQRKINFLEKLGVVKKRRIKEKKVIRVNNSVVDEFKND